MSSTGVLAELDALRLFLQERVQEFDSSIDTTLGSNFDNQVIQPLVSRIGPDPYATGIVDFIHGRLLGDFGPEDLILQDGEPIDDLVVRPNRILLEAFRRQIRLVSLNQSLANPELLNEQEADNLAANFFARRRQGGFSIGTARLFFTSPQFVLVTPSNSLFTGSGLQFFPIESQAITADRMIFNEEDNLFYFDIVVRAEQQGSVYDIPFNTLTTIEGITSAVKVTNRRAFEGGGNKEGTQAFIERVERSLTERSLVTTRGINARLVDTFENIRLIQVIGHGDPEMMRDIITGNGEEKPYAIAELDTPVFADRLELDSATAFYTSAGGVDYTLGLAKVGDLVQIFDFIGGGGLVSEHTVVKVLSNTEVQVTPDVTVTIDPGDFAMFRRAIGKITISDIPGGILGPDPTIQINDNEIHIGGAYDVFVRAGAPQERDTTLEGILDAAPLRFGVDLETYGSEPDQFVHVTERVFNQMALPANDRFGTALGSANLLELVVKKTDASATEINPWVPNEDDVDRFVQLVALAGVDYFGTFRIAEILGEEYFAGEECVRFKIDVADQERAGIDAEWITNLTGPVATFTLDFRIVEKVSIKNRVRDRDRSTTVIAAGGGDPAILGGINFSSIGATIGDSVVIETGDDAGIYSIRRILDWLASGDTLILDRDLTDTVKTTGPQSGLRYRLADELNVDLVTPKVPKIPLGTIFLGNDLSTVAESTTVSVTGSTNFLLAGVAEGDTLEITAGDNAAKFGVVSVTGTTAVLDAAPASTLSGQTFEVYRSFTGISRPMVRVKEIELLDSNSQPTGITIPYGDAIDARVLGTLSNRASGNVVESFTGATQNNGAGIVDLFDANIDFDAEGIEGGHRINIISGNSIGSYTVLGTGTDPSIGLTANHVRVVAAADGGTAFIIPETPVHYSMGLPSAGIVRLFFLEPTSVELQTGLSGGRLQFGEGGVTPKVLRFSEVSGYTIVPARGTTDDDARDLRVVRTYFDSQFQATDGVSTIATGTFTSASAAFLTTAKPVGVLRINAGPDAGDYDITTVDSDNQLTVSPVFPVGDVTVDFDILEYNSLIELTDPNRPGVYELEIQDGDTVEVNEPIPFRVPNSGAPLLGQTFDAAGVFGAPAPLQTRAGDNLVTIPANSLIDFTVMNASFPLAGQILAIESGPDAGQYIIEEVVSAKSLRLNTLMINTVGALEARDVNSRTGLALAVSGLNTKLTDTDDIGQLALLAEGQFITIFESTRSDIDGTYEVSDLLVGTADSVEIETTFTNHAVDLDTKTVGPFSWIGTDTATIGFPFHIYKSIAAEFSVLEVAPKGADLPGLLGVRRGEVFAGSHILTDKAGTNLVTAGVLPGDIVEVIDDVVIQGIYYVESVLGSNITIRSEIPFPASAGAVAYRVWSGIHGSRRMLRVGPKDSSTGRIVEGDLTPYRVLRPDIQRVSSTEMEENFDGTLHFVDVQVESDGAGDDLNLVENSRMVVTSGLTADGYTYTPENENLTYSTFEEVVLNFDRRFLPVGNSDSPDNLTEVSGRNLSVKYETSTTTKLVNDLLRSDQDRVVNANPIARHFLPSFLFTTLQYQGGVTEQTMGPQLEELVNNLGAEEELRVSDMEAVLVKNGAEGIEHPINLVTVTHDLGRKLVVNRSDNKVGGLNTVPFNGTGRISAFFAEFEETLILVRES